MYATQHYTRRGVSNSRLSTYNNIHRSNRMRTRQYPPNRHYVIHHNLFSIDNKFTIYENDNEVYQVHGGRLFVGINNLVLEDRFGVPLIRIEKESGHFFVTPYKLFSYDGRELARIKRPFAGSRSQINTIYGPYRLEMWGTPSDGRYSLWNAQNQFIARRQNGVEVAGNQDQAFVLALIIAIDHFKPSPPPPPNRSMGKGYGGIA